MQSQLTCRVCGAVMRSSKYGVCKRTTACRSEYQRAYRKPETDQRYRQEHAEEIKSRSRSYYKQNRAKELKRKQELTAEQKRAVRERVRMSHGLTPPQARAVRQVVGKCMVCGATSRLVIDHNHETGNVRGVLCANCNVALGLFKDSLEVLRNAIDYLTKGELDWRRLINASQ